MFCLLTRKFHDIAVTLSNSFKNNILHKFIAEKYDQICTQYNTKIQQLEYYQFILEDDREKAFKKYILDYTKPDSLDAVACWCK